MSQSDHETPAKIRLTNAYDQMMQRVHSVIEGTEDHLLPPLKRNIELARERAVTLGELSKEEAEKIAAYLHRDMEDAGHYLADSGQELADWLRLDLAAIEDRVLELLISVADKTKLEWLELDRTLREGSRYHSGEITGPGTLQCDHCNNVQQFYATAHIVECAECGGNTFRRVSPKESLD